MPNIHCPSKAFGIGNYRVGPHHQPDIYPHDYAMSHIFKWVHPAGDEKYFKFWVAPVTMVFENAYDVKVDIDSQQGEIEVADLHMENPRKTKNGKFTEYTFRFECQGGEITLTATGLQTVCP